MTHATAVARRPDGRPLRHAELVGLIAAMLAINAAAIDAMLPTLAAIDSSFALEAANHRQLVIITYLLAFGLAQPFYGPLSDRFGRRRVLFASIAAYSAMGLACAVAQSFPQLLGARALQGAAAAGPRVIAGSIVRDVSRGTAMASVLSQATAIFMAIPIFAPGLGQGLVVAGGWRWVCSALALFGACVLLWIGGRLGETLPPERRRPIDVAAVAKAYRHVFRLSTTRGYVVAEGMVFGALFAFLSSAEQLFVEVYAVGHAFPLWLAAIIGSLVVSAAINARVVGQVGMRRTSHLALVTFGLVSGAQWVLADGRMIDFPVFVTLVGACFFLLGMMGTNFFSIAMEPLGELAGTGSAAFGFAATVLAGAVGGYIAQQFDGTPLPLIQGMLACAGIAIFAILITERGRLFGPDP